VEVKEAVQKAKVELLELFADEAMASTVRLEEVVLSDSSDWMITLSYLRSHTLDAGSGGLAAVAASLAAPRRVYKIVQMRKSTGEIVSIKMRSND